MIFSKRHPLLPGNRSLRLLATTCCRSNVAWKDRNREDIRALFVLVLAAIATLTISLPAKSQEHGFGNIGDFSTNPLQFAPDQGTRLTPRSGVSIFSDSPSRFFGNMFNEEIRPLKEDEAFRVEDVLIYPGIGGNQIWLRLSPEKNGECSAELSECWALYGIQPKTENPHIWNFVQEDD